MQCDVSGTKSPLIAERPSTSYTYKNAGEITCARERSKVRSLVRPPSSLRSPRRSRFLQSLAIRQFVSRLGSCQPKVKKALSGSPRASVVGVAGH